jgi:hypothetical protein
MRVHRCGGNFAETLRVIGRWFGSRFDVRRPLPGPAQPLARPACCIAWRFRRVSGRGRIGCFLWSFSHGDRRVKNLSRFAASIFKIDEGYALRRRRNIRKDNDFRRFATRWNHGLSPCPPDHYSFS